MIAAGIDDNTGIAAPGRDAVPEGTSSYPGGKSGAGVFQRLINLIPPHRVLITAFAGRCGITRNIRPAEHTIVIDADADVCQWWADWRRKPEGRSIEIHHCDGIEWLRHRFGLTEYSDAETDVARANLPGGADDRRGDRGSRTITRPVMAIAAENAGSAGSLESSASAADVASGDGRPTCDPTAEAFVFGDPPYVLSERAHGKQYACELDDDDHRRLVRTLSAIPASRAAVMLCGYPSELYAPLIPPLWRSIDHRVPTRGGLQDERLWMNYARPTQLHDYRYIGADRRSRERIRRRQRNWSSQLRAMDVQERAAMLAALQREAKQ